MMTEGQAETVEKPATEPTPAPANTVAENTPAPVAETKTPEPQPTNSKEVARTMFQKRQGEKEKKSAERIAELEAKLSQFEAQKPEPKPAKSEAPSLLDDPDGYAKWVQENATKTALSEIERRESEAQSAYAYRQASEKAADFLLTRSHLKEDKSLVDEVSKIISEKYADIGVVNPSAAARLAYVDLCAAKGIVPDMDGFKSGGFNATGGASSTSVRPSAPGAAKREWSKRDAEKYLMEAAKDKAMFASRSAEIKEARSEGRIK
jgi:hypothetical protein